MESLVSIIVPIYNVESYLENCIESILRQTYRNLEIILVNDGSPDKCGDICDAYAEKDSRIKVIKKSNGGLSSARNVGMKVATADYWCFVDSDDWISENMIEILMREFKNDIDLVCCGKVLSSVESEVTVCAENSMCLSSEKAIEKSLFDKDVGIAAWGKIYRRYLFENIKFPEGEIHEDAAIMLQIFDRARMIYVLDKALYYYRYNADGISKSSYSKKFDVVLKHNINNERFIIEKYPEMEQKAKAMVANGCYGMMLKILKTENGFETFQKQYFENKSYYTKRIHEFTKECSKRPKDYIWMLILLSCNRVTIKLFRNLGIAQ